MNEYMLTTRDNPYSPFTQFSSWYMFDCEKEYNTCSRLARITRMFDGMTQNEEQIERENAIDEIIKYDPLNIYIKVTEDYPFGPQTKEQMNLYNEIFNENRDESA